MSDRDSTRRPLLKGMGTAVTPVLLQTDGDSGWIDEDGNGNPLDEALFAQRLGIGNAAGVVTSQQVGG